MYKFSQKWIKKKHPTIFHTWFNKISWVPYMGVHTQLFCKLMLLGVFTPWLKYIELRVTCHVNHLWRSECLIYYELPFVVEICRLQALWKALGLDIKCVCKSTKPCSLFCCHVSNSWRPQQTLVLRILCNYSVVVLSTSCIC